MLKERLEHHRRLELAGVGKPDIDFGPIVILWARTRDDADHWVVLPKRLADVVVSDMHNDPTVEKAAIYHRIPKNAPMDVAKEWLRARMGKPVLMPDRVLAAQKGEQQ